MGKRPRANPGGFNRLRRVMEEKKKEVLGKLKSTGAIHRYDRHEEIWKEAFELYRVETGEHLSLKCGKCFSKVKEWLSR